MRICQLNVWMGKVEGELERFLQNNQFDVICMQEVMHAHEPETELHLSRLCVDASRLQKASGMPHAYFSANWSSKIANGKFDLGNLILSRIPIIEEKYFFVNGEYLPDVVLQGTPSNALCVQIAKLKNGVTVLNHHGFWRKNPTGDENSVRAFNNLAEIIKREVDINEPLVLCGDLNVIHESPAMRALDFLRDLTFENGVDNTLSGLKFNGKVACDHIMVNDRMRVESFEVMQSMASDHLPVIAEMEVK
ncbi:endonuclease/exonuclease/phosphatase family protein [Candidatus Saccharibacteria bacterium]|nr:endonuclease/exonuclease/phosphatase family protein [Candidatus Saccharibacteria bacterium]